MIVKMLYIISGTLWAIEMIPQIIRTYKRKTTKDISISFPLICFISFVCFIIASIIAKNWILIKTHILPFICNAIFLTQNIIYRRNK